MSYSNYINKLSIMNISQTNDELIYIRGQTVSILKSIAVTDGGKDYVVGVFVQANFGDRKELRIHGQDMSDLDVPNPIGESTWIDRDKSRTVPGGAGSVIVVVATNAPLLPDQCRALARRVPLADLSGHFHL